MSLEVKIPSVGESITSGVISAWHKADGEAVTKGDTILTLDTDKVSTDLTAEESGIIRIKVQAGEEVTIGQLVAVIEPGAHSAPAAVATAAAATAAAAAPAAVLEAPKVQPAPASTAAVVSAPVQTLTVVADHSASNGAALRAAVEAANHSLGVLQGSGEPAVLSESRTSRKRMTPLRRKIRAPMMVANTAEKTTANSKGTINWPSNQCFCESAAA